MSIDFDVDLRMVRFVIVSLLIVCGIKYQDLALLVGL